MTSNYKMNNDTTPAVGNTSSTLPQTQPATKQSAPEPFSQQPTTATDIIPPLRTVIASLHERIQSFLSEQHPPGSLLHATQQQTRTSLSVIRTALSRYKIHELCLSYNGGKDCLVLLILFLAGLHEKFADSSQPDCCCAQEKLPSSIPAIYALPPDPFDAVESFVLASARQYHLSITRYVTDPPRSTLRSSFEDYLARNRDVKAIFAGTRRSDPHGADLTHFDPTDHGWPDFVRINAVIDWHYAEIWAFIRHLGVAYCPLYDQGYTSLGGTTDTLPNPRLRVQSTDGDDSPDRDQSLRYRPAYELTEDLEERLGRG